MYESVFHGDNAAQSLARQVVQLLDRKRAGLATDVDGTISPIAARPEEAIVLPKARQALAGLKDLLEVVAVVTGRSAEDARKMVGIDDLTYIGNHGLEMWREGRAETLPEAQPWVPRMAAVLDEVAKRLAAGPAEFVTDKGEAEVNESGPLTGVITENKGPTASFHYRLAPDTDEARRRLLEILASYTVTSGLRIEEGRMVINLLPPLTVTKGSAVSWLVKEHQLQSVVYLGDDVTDAHAFRALKVLRESQGIHTLAIGVVGADAPPSIRQLADATLPSVAAVADLLWDVFEALKSSDTMKVRAPKRRK